MVQTLYFRLFLIALCSLSECIQRRYHYINIEKTWTAAQSYCREKYTDLATINNMKDIPMVTSVNNGLYVWIGLQNTSFHKWKWSLGYPVNYLNWENVESNGQNNCAFMRNGKWSHQDCNEKLRFICYNERSKGYIYETSNKTWREAQSFCRQYHTDLTSVRNQTENEQIEKIINDSQKSVWIGLFSDSWEWSDKSDSGFRNWNSGEPNGGSDPQCTDIRMVEQGKLHDMGCHAFRTFVCHEDKLVLIKENLSFPEALRYCSENYVDLVSVDSEEIQHWLTEVVKQASTAQVWLGLHYYCYMNMWIWVKGEIVCYQNWAPGNQTNLQDCRLENRAGAVQSGGDQLWISLPQTHKLNFICSRYEE